MVLICAYVGDDCIDPDCDATDVELYARDKNVHFEIGTDGGTWIKAKIRVIKKKDIIIGS